MTLPRIGYARFPLLLVAMSLLGCPPRVLPRNPTEQLVEWTLGPENRADPQSPDVILVGTPKEKLKPNPPPPPPPPPQPKTSLSTGSELAIVGDKLSGCVRATSFVPDPQDNGRFFLAVDGALHVLRLGEKTTTPLAGLAPGVSIKKLAGTREVPEGLELLAWVQIEGKSDTEMHAIVVNALGIVRSGIADIRVERFMEVLERYTIPRCTPDARQCLEISKDDDSTYIDQRSRAPGANSAPVALAKIPGLVDVTWTPKNDGSVYTLQRCLPSDGAAPPAPQ